MEQHSLTLDNISVAREGVPLIHGLHMTINPGDLLMVEGANGSGKSTLLQCLAGLLPLASGKVLLGATPLTSTPDYPNNLLYLGHKRGLQANISVRGNVAFWARIRRNPELTNVALHYFDLEDVADMPCRMLSAGWQQRVALTRLITMPARLWLLDEPMANLDEGGAALLHSLIMSRIEQKGIVIMTTHAQVQGERHKRLDLTSIPKSILH
ncbi:MAG: heme ABC exporter ATP-binding protein CcmA [Alphaproteobacteria bacterium]